MSKTPRTPTGIAGLDDILSGGIPSGRVVLVLGGPGCGKTILSTQFLVRGIEKYGENAVFISLDENKQHYFNEMANFGWDLASLEKKKKYIFIDASPIRNIPTEVQIGKTSIGKKDFSMLSLIEVMKASVKSINATRLVIDPIASLVLQYPDVVNRRNAVVDLMEAIIGTGATTIINSERLTTGMDEEREIQLEEYLAHGVIMLQDIRVGRASMRVIRVQKMRGIPIETQPHPYKIGNDGIEVFSKESVF